MIIEVLIASVALVTSIGTLAGLRFASRHLEREAAPDPEEQPREAERLFRKAVASGLPSDRREVEAMLFTTPEAFPPDLRRRVVLWLNGKDIPLPM